MPRARPAARKSEARRRIYRYRTKWTHDVIPERVKRLLFEPPHHMWDVWEDELKGASPVYVECEEPTMTELQAVAVPEAEWPYYLGFMKRMITLYLQYTSLTLQMEKTNLIEEYVLRGKDRDVLEAIQTVAEWCALKALWMPVWSYDVLVGTIWMPEPKGVYGGNYDDRQ